MFSVLPDLTPRDSHSLWYTSTRNPTTTPSNLDPSLAGQPGQDNGAAATSNGVNNARTSRPAQAAIIERSVLGRLRADEIHFQRRLANVGNLGSTWIKPPGVTKTLFQLREERREALEHAEAVRREMLAQELAEAEAGAGVGGDDPMDVLPMEDMDADEAMVEDTGRDLDEDIPDADEGGFGFDGASDDEDDEEEESDSERSASDEDNDEEDLDDDDAEAEANASSLLDTHGDENGRQQRRELANHMATIRATEDRLREMLARGGQVDGGGDLYGADEDEDEDDRAHILEEDDLVPSTYPGDLEPGTDMGMGADLDDDIPEASEGGGYEHTDSEASLSSSDDEDESRPDISYAAAAAAPQPRNSNVYRPPRTSQVSLPPRSSLAAAAAAAGRGDGPRSSIDISGILSRDESSSVTGSSPRIRRGNH
ncbi:Apc15p protein-domain-containing protein [Cercophora scortea]|uniref:Apc15p protein-domain-containing protein n=1 Tax=Cercophora scortea TaxID=314031 RepID=A0AAE0M6H2_9PEZI|nr:Apc15p protein-domain-containing protein [Cercophora scortea]